MLRYAVLLFVLITYVQAERIRFRIVGKDLPKYDRLTEIDPYIKIYYTSRAKVEDTLFGRTEQFWGERNPRFPKTFSVNFMPGAFQQLHFKLYDRSSFLVANDNFVGEGTLNVDDHIRNDQESLVTLTNGSKFAGTLLISRA